MDSNSGQVVPRSFRQCDRTSRRAECPFVAVIPAIHIHGREGR